MSEHPPSKRATVTRQPRRGAYDRPTIDAILDQGLICHVGFSIDGETFVIPTIHVRVGDQVYLHGSRASRMMQALAGGADICLAVTIVDGLVLARSAFHHSMNYRSVVLFGKASIVEDDADKVAALRSLTEHLIPGRWADVRGPSEQELRQTMVLALPIQEASAKLRSGPPKDDDVDYSLPFWAGVIPLRLAADEAICDPKLRPNIKPPSYAVNYPGPR
jgi:nitroimidazol reductase NimA-like FMN-containing flavoprotein (pyridoxamine 5'-phosphate oxidase superfamily)